MVNMKLKIFLAGAFAALFLSMPAAAQSRYGRYNGPAVAPRGANYSYHKKSFGLPEDSYFRLHIGPAFTSFSSRNSSFDEQNSRTGLNVGFAYGRRLTNEVPLYLEAGLSYIQKGAKYNYGVGNAVYGDKKLTYAADYLQLPIVLKLRFDLDNDMSISPYFGGYLALGIAGKNDDSSNDTFGSNGFKRFDGGLRFGAQFNYSVAFVALTYDLGLSDISNNSDVWMVKNRALSLTFGVEF